MKLLATATVFGAALGGGSILFAGPTEGAAQPRRPAAAGQSLCRAGEQAIFQCRIGARRVAVCAGRSSGGESLVQYRFGRPGRVELAFPERGSAGLSWGRIGYSGGGEMQINFERGGHRYVLYSRMTAGAWHRDGTRDHHFAAGVAVVRGNRLVSDRQCSDTDDPWIAEAETERLLPEGEPTRWWDLEE